MAARLGIGIITCNRKDVLAETLARVREHTKAPVELVVADDGSGDGTDELVRARNIALVTGPNMGIAWNKNRALFLLAAIRQCDAIILLEETRFPPRTAGSSPGCGRSSSGAMSISQAAGSGTASSADRGPWRIRSSARMSAPSAAVSRAPPCSTAAISTSRFRGYGQEHVEHTRRLVRIGYGGTYEEIDGEVRPVYHLLQSGIQVTNPNSFSNQSDRDRNWLICRELLFDEAYRMPWRDDAEMMQFRAEIARAAP